MTILIRVDQEKYQIHVGSGGAANDDGKAANTDGGDTTITLPTGVLKAAGGKSAKMPDHVGGSTFLGGGGNQDAPNATGNCAGGGGKYYTVTSDKKSAAGAGSSGYVSIFPMPDMARFARVLALMENIPPSTPGQGSASATASPAPVPAN